MNPGITELRWAYFGLALLLVIDFLVAFMVVGTARLLLLGLLLLFQLLLICIMQRLILIVRGYRLIKESYEKELNFTQQVMDSSDQGMAVLDSQGRIIFVNSAAAQLVGLQPQDLLGRDPKDFLMPEDQVTFQQQLKDRWTGKQDSYALHLRHADGHAVTLEIRGTPRWHQGRIVGNFAVFKAL